MTTASEVSEMHKMFGVGDYRRPGDFAAPRPKGWSDRDWKRHCELQAEYHNKGQYRAALMMLYRERNARAAAKEPKV
jgi:hypothetical protein